MGEIQKSSYAIQPLEQHRPKTSHAPGQCNRGLNARTGMESWPWRRKFSCCSCRDLNPQPFDHESSALTTELSLLPPAKEKDQQHGSTVTPPEQCSPIPNRTTRNYRKEKRTCKQRRQKKEEKKTEEKKT